MPRQKKPGLDAGKVGQKEAFTLAEIGEESIIDQEAESHFDMVGLELEKFMNEIITIVLADGPKGCNKVEMPNVNGKNQPILRGAKQKVRRKYIEALARARTETFVQVQARADDRASLKMVPTSTLKYPFTVINDPNPVGYAWLEGILNQPM